MDDFADQFKLVPRQIITLNSVERHPKAGCMKGTFNLNSGFDEPLEDFKEFME